MFFHRSQHQSWTIGALVALGLLLSFVISANAQEEDNGEAPKSITVADVKIPLRQLEYMVRPLTRDELAVEAEAWLAVLKTKQQEISDAEITSRKMAEAEATAEAAEDATEQPADDAPADESAGDTSDETDGDETGEASKPATGMTREELLSTIPGMVDERAAIIERFEVVLAELELKGGDVEIYHQYIDAVAGVSIDVDDAQGAWIMIKGWLASEQGGIRWAMNIGKFLAVVIVFWILARIFAALTHKAINRTQKTSQLLKEFLVNMVRRSVIIIGLIVAVAQLGVNIGPLVAAIGALGLVIGLALQGTLSNFASGLLILWYRPYDVGDAINAGGTSGKVENMNLVSTVITTFDNQKIIVPNNAIWNNVITNITGKPIRRVDMTFGIAYDADMSKATEILNRLTKEHELVLDDPEPTIKVHALGDSSVNIICRPWAKTADYWTVFWDFQRRVKEEFDAADIGIPFPQRDLHVYYETAEKKG